MYFLNSLFRYPFFFTLYSVLADSYENYRNAKGDVKSIKCNKKCIHYTFLHIRIARVCIGVALLTCRQCNHNILFGYNMLVS